MTIFKTVYVYFHDQTASKQFATIPLCTLRGAKKLQQPGRYYRVGTDGNVGIKRTWFEAVARTRSHLRKFPVGTTVVMRAYGSDDSFLDQVRFRKIETLPNVPNGRGVQGIDRFEAYVRGFFPKARFAGDCVCKSNSDHADCAAVDYFAQRGQMEEMRDVALEYAWYFDTKYVILYDRIYIVTSNGFTSSAYSGDYHSHIHVSVTGGIQNAAC